MILSGQYSDLAIIGDCTLDPVWHCLVLMMIRMRNTW